MRSSANQLATRCDDGECLALWENVTIKEGDAFLASMRMRDVPLLMGEGLYTNCSFGMHHLYSQAALGRCAFCFWRRGGTPCAERWITGSSTPMRLSHLGHDKRAAKRYNRAILHS